LPPSLQISTKDLEKMTVPQAADLVDRINAHRAVQKMEADKLAAQKSIEVYKEYPETEEGLRWVEIKMLPYPEILPEGFEIVNKAPKAIHVRKIGEEQVIVGRDLKDVIDGIYKYHPDTPGNPKKALEEALRYEGDIMQHCVGGYCPDVISGESRIFSLRDNTGRPHATVEVKPSGLGVMNPSEFYHSRGVPESLLRRMDEAEAAGELDKTGSWESFVRNSPEYKDYIDRFPQRIAQVKGLNNEKLEDKYIPFVHDFLGTQKWSSIGDLQNIDLVELKPTILQSAQDRGFNPKVAAEAQGKVYITKKEFNRLADLFGGMNKYAAGGEVTQFIKAHA
jgi:hypothetical protein